MLADGSIRDVSYKSSYSDLYWALRGGGNNFGIVTRFDLATYPQGDLWAGAKTFLYTKETAAAVDNAFYYLGINGPSDPYAQTIVAYAYAQTQGVFVIATDLQYGKPVANPPIFQNFTSIPGAIADTMRILVRLALLCAALAAIPLFLAARLTDHATATWTTRPAAALADLELARRLNPLAASIPLNEGVIAVELRAPRRARRAFTIAAERDPSAWYPLLALALLEARDGRRAAALELLRQAGARNPGEPTLPGLRRDIRRGKTPNVRATQRIVLNGPS